VSLGFFMASIGSPECSRWPSVPSPQSVWPGSPVFSPARSTRECRVWPTWGTPRSLRSQLGIPSGPSRDHLESRVLQPRPATSTSRPILRPRFWRGPPVASIQPRATGRFVLCSVSPNHFLPCVAQSTALNASHRLFRPRCPPIRSTGLPQPIRHNSSTVGPSFS
jgi:hypothetical protein